MVASIVEDDGGYSRYVEDQERVRRAPDRARQWFDEFYFDPTNAKDVNSEDAYRWDPQDPIDPAEVLAQQFEGDLSPKVIAEVASELRRRSNNWRARPDVLPSISPINRGSQWRASEILESAKSELLSQLGILENLVVDLSFPKAEHGHNGPPEALVDIPVTTQDIDTLLASVNSLRTEAISTKPSAESIKADERQLSDFAKKVMDWAGERGTKFVDAALSATGKAAGTAFILKITGLLPQIFAVAAAANSVLVALAHVH